MKSAPILSSLMLLCPTMLPVCLNTMWGGPACHGEGNPYRKSYTLRIPWACLPNWYIGPNFDRFSGETEESTTQSLEKPPPIWFLPSSFCALWHGGEN